MNLKEISCFTYTYKNNALHHIIFYCHYAYPLVIHIAFRKCANKDCSYSPKDVQEQGEVYIFDVLYPNIKLVSKIEGPAKFSKFGSSLAVGYPFGVTSNPFLAVGAPSVGQQLWFAWRSLCKFWCLYL